MSGKQVIQLLRGKMQDLVQLIATDNNFKDNFKKFCDKLQMIFDEGNKVNTTDYKMSVDRKNDIWTYRVDTNFIVKSLGDSFHDMFDNARSPIERSLTSFQEILLARFASSFQKNNDPYNLDLCYKILQIYFECRDKVPFFLGKNRIMNTRVDGNLIADVINNTELKNYDETPNDDQFFVSGNIIEYRHITQYRNNVVANLLLDARYNPASPSDQSQQPTTTDDDINFAGMTEDQVVKLTYNKYKKSSLEPVFANLFALYSGDGLLELIRYTNEYMNYNNDKLKDNAQIIREGNKYLPTVRSCFPNIQRKPRELIDDTTSTVIGHDDTTFDIRQVVKMERENNFKLINDENTRMLVGDGDVVVVADFDKRTSFMRNLSENYPNKVVLSRVLATSLDEAPDGFSRTIIQLNSTANTTTSHSYLFQGDNISGENTITFQISDKKLYSYTVNKEERNEVLEYIVNNFLRVGAKEQMNMLDRIPGIYEKIVKRMEIKETPVYNLNIEELELKRKNRDNVLLMLKESESVVIIHKILTDETRCFLEITLHNSPFVEEDNPMRIEKISVKNMSSKINELMKENKKSINNQQYIQNLINIDMLLQGKACGDIFPSLSTLTIVNTIKSQEFYQELPSSQKITSTVITSADKNAILNLLSLARINFEKFDKAIIIFNHSIDSDENSTAVRIGNNSDIFNEYGNGRLDTIPKFFKLGGILEENQRRIQYNMDPNPPPEIPSSFLGKVLSFFGSINVRKRVLPKSPDRTLVVDRSIGKETQPSPYSRTPSTDEKKNNLFSTGNVNGSPLNKIGDDIASDKKTKKKGGTSHKPKFTRRKTKNSPKRKTIKKRKMPKRNAKTRRQRK
jgi:hypothetical protein